MKTKKIIEKNKNGWGKSSQIRALIAAGRRQRCTVDTLSVALPLGDSPLIGAIVSTTKNKNKRLSNWRAPLPCRQSGGYNTSTINYRGNYTGWRGSEYSPRVQSWATITTQGATTAVIAYCGTVRTITAPIGWEYSVDVDGLLIQRSDNHDINYHPYGHEAIRGGNFLRSIATANYRERQKKLHATRAERAQLSRGQKIPLDCVLVFDIDSILAGNCETATDDFVRRFAAPERCLPASDVLSIAQRTGQIERAKLAVEEAQRRYGRGEIIVLSQLSD